MKILVLSQYFAPEPGATQNRMGAFVDGLVAQGHHVTVISEQPCHPAGVFHAGFGHRPLMTERAPGRAVHRIWVAASPRKTTIRRLAFYTTFAAGAALATAVASRHDVALMTSPPLPGVLAAAGAAAVRRLPVVVDVRDLWPAAAEALGELNNRHVIAALGRAERWLYHSAYRVTATTRPFCHHIDAVAGRPVSTHLPNGALDALVALADTAPPAREPFTVGYAGNLGIAQGLRIAIDAAERLKNEPVRFILLGDGPLASDLRAEATRRRLEGIEFRPAVPVEEVGPFLQSCHALLVPLRDHPLLDDFIPSKLYDAMAVGRPTLVAARGQAADLVRSTSSGVSVPPEDGDALAQAVRHLASRPDHARDLGRAGRRAARDLRRSRQLKRLEAILYDAAGRPPEAGRTHDG